MSVGYSKERTEISWGILLKICFGLIFVFNLFALWKGLTQSEVVITLGVSYFWVYLGLGLKGGGL